MTRRSRLVPMNSVAGVIIAAGSSSRLGQPKQLLVSQEETLLHRAIRLANEVDTHPVLVVLGAHREQIELGVDLSAARVVVNPDWEEGMAASIRVAILALRERASGAAGVLLMVCDQPAVTAEHLRRMLAAFEQDRNSAIASVYAGKRGIPAIFPRASFAELLALRGDTGARGLLSDPNRQVIELALEGGGVDIDRPEDLLHLRAL
jgi:molybdenum cofactor cytidylyltransferase